MVRRVSPRVNGFFAQTKFRAHFDRFRKLLAQFAGGNRIFPDYREAQDELPTSHMTPKSMARPSFQRAEVANTNLEEAATFATLPVPLPDPSRFTVMNRTPSGSKQGQKNTTGTNCQGLFSWNGDES